MTLFFLLLQATRFHQILQPALAECWRQRAFGPCQRLIEELRPVAQAFAARYGPAEEKSLLQQVAEGLPFQRALWPLLAGEVLLHGATEIAPVEADPETLCRLLTDEAWEDEIPRERFAPIHQVLWGARDLVFGAKFYRPQHAGINERADVARLATYLATVNPHAWSAAALPLVDPAEREEELDFARQSLTELRELYERAQMRECVIIREVL